MAHLNITSNRAFLPSLHSLGPLTAAVLMVTAAISMLMLASLVPPPLLMPVLSLVSFLAAGVIALFAYYSGADRHTPGITLWDVAGVFALIWIGAGMLSEPEHVIQLFGHVAMAQ